nr:alpha/beta-tubulin-N-acetyltransferase 9-like isoform X2 [Cherax quadricarinatus]XP_053629232.1 alpha/beta-tubulin-N-acetyltransferase 9-like isoform X2 [Cherax quadricarinatus]XP_053629233.1 alpha/beta-tubulin-N-acetyltransferase 9-like isoform X2 [Cherax quadricarinatus]
MRINSKIKIVGDKVILVPYNKLHVEKYHQWMLSPRLQELTASEPLTLEEEYQMQQSWFSDDDKCTFIILDRGLMTEKNSEVEAMIGDTNLFLVDPEDRSLAEGEIMIAETGFRKQKRGWEAMLLMFLYGVETLGIKRYQVKIGFSNTPSINMFRKMHFNEVGKSDIFQEVTLEVQANEKWKAWLLENVKCYITPYENNE